MVNFRFANQELSLLNLVALVAACAKSLESVHQEQIGQKTAMPIYVGFAIGSNQNWGNKINSCGVHRDQLFPKLFLASREFKSKDLRRNFSGAINKKRAPV